MRYAHIMHELTSTPWAILPDKLGVIAELLTLKVGGGAVPPSELDQLADLVAARQAAREQPPPEGTLVAVLPLVGTIFPRANLMTDMSGGVSLDRWTSTFEALVADDLIRGIVIDIDSPGGITHGVMEAHDVVRAARGRKPVIAQANHLAASAAYWIASAADEIVASPSAEVGSIGVYGMHVDRSAANEQAGVKPTIISAGRYKTEADPNAPLSEEAASALQARVDAVYGEFVGDVAAARGIEVEEVRNGYGQGRVLKAGPALAAGMVDRVGTLASTIARLMPRDRRGSAVRAELALEAARLQL